MAHEIKQFAERGMPRCLALDLELTRKSRTLRSIGAVLGDRTFEWHGDTTIATALAALDAFGRGAEYVLGHNIFNHDLHFLQALAPDLNLLDLPVVDTLYLSPLAFPRNPYHRLVKDYKLVRSGLSDPVQDARLALSIFQDQLDSLAAQAETCPEIVSFYRFAMAAGRFGGFTGQGLATVLDHAGAFRIQTSSQAADIFGQLTRGIACRMALERRFGGSGDPAEVDPAAAYALAWLRVAGANSVLPPWVRHQFPGVVPLLKQLRDIPCGDPACDYCRQNHDPDQQLKRFFGFDGFRPTPAGRNGSSLQRDVVLHGLRGQPLLAILPTGGGKSICYQLPALVRQMRRGLLTVVISPLQALMKDQVDNLVKHTGTPYAAAIYGLLAPPERGEVMERVRLGDIAILYLSPEQLRSRSVRQVLALREIGAWVFDEAHCLSKWGHDFRPDYLYAARFIREFSQEQQLPIPPIACYTATAKLDVIEEIRSCFQAELKQDLLLFEGGVERENLHFDIWPVSGAEKPAWTYEIVARYTDMDAPAGVIVYSAKRKTTEAIRDYLVQRGLVAEAFHAGLEANEKRRVIESFVAGETPVICATNAFGMGIDKENIRLVLHYDISGSLENYLQEGGRAGRDRQPADCILLYDPEDAETQFKLGAHSEIKKEEIQRILKCLRRSKTNPDDEVVITTQELIRDEEMSEVFERGDPANDTRVRTAVSWLERADFLKREHNLTQVFQGRPRVKNLAEADPPDPEAGAFRYHGAPVARNPGHYLQCACRPWTERRRYRRTSLLFGRGAPATRTGPRPETRPDGHLRHSRHGGRRPSGQRHDPVGLYTVPRPEQRP
ncbi:RecQ family ATP-dependent DNA helicase [Desulfatitalea tepidiphila]|uniref:RecQ family ATP-dependent DNA helicase n=1 Tax=Desulfatitalea tepidiphila TaxID=1185843 RepID=UPI0009F9FB26|nr:RecQ family ATP-dependent DNA helicase [Desulfatitalea tepidiphila]